MRRVTSHGATVEAGRVTTPVMIKRQVTDPYFVNPVGFVV